ncbi:MAG: hypothetical protein IKC48_02900 [Clostridia bacterium]|nr:hypothetical protein [Clostridia bacterium]
MKKKLLLLLIAALACCTTLAAPSATRADSAYQVDATVLNYSSATLYHTFTSPSDVYYSDGKLFVFSANGWDVFEDGAVTKTEISADSFAFVSGTTVVLLDGTVSVQDTVVTNDVDAISAYGSALYVLKGNEIHKYEYTEGAFDGGALYASPSLPITAIAAGENGCAYAVTAADGYTSQVYVADSLITSITEEIIDLEYNGSVYILTATKIIKQTNSYDSAEYTVTGARAITLGEHVYAVLRTGTVERITLNLSSSTPIIASSGDVDWFYSSPADTTTRLGKIYVADSMLNRVAVIDGQSISYLTGLNRPVAVAVDNNENVYVAHYGNRIACFTGGVMTSEIEASGAVTALETDNDGSLYYLTGDGNVTDASGNIVRTGVKAFAYASDRHYLTDTHLDDVAISATDFCVDIEGNLFAASGNTVISIIGDIVTTYRVNGITSIDSIAISKVSNQIISYGDLVLCDKNAKAVFTVSGSLVGSANLDSLYPEPEISNEPIAKTTGIIAKTTTETFMFDRPIEGKINHVVAKNTNIIVCNDVSCPDPFAYCLAENPNTNTLYAGYVYKSNYEVLPYVARNINEAKINADNTPIYKYPSLKAPIVATYSKDVTVSILPFAVCYTDEYDDGWYVDAYANKWYRIAVGEKEGFVLSGDTNVNFFGDMEMPKTNATITENAVLYRYDEASGAYVEFEAAGLYIAKETRVAVETPFDTSREYTKIVFYRDGYGTIDTDCYVKTQYVDFDGVDILKIVAIAAIAVSIATLVLILYYKRKNAKKPKREDR